MDAALEVAVARQDTAADQVLLLDGLDDGLGQRSGIADARHTAVADDVESELLQRRYHARFLQVVRDHARARRQRRFDVWSHCKAGLDCLLGQ